MAFADEEIIQFKKAIRNQEFTDIETTGIYIQDKLVFFVRQYMFEDGLVVLIPEEFIDMPASVSRLKYPSVDRPKIIKTSLDGTVNFVFNRIEQPIIREQVEELAGQLKQVLRTTNPRMKFQQEETEETPSGNSISLFEFFNHGVDSRIYNLFFVMGVENGVIQGSFNCLEKDVDHWREAAWSVFTRMEENNKHL